MCKLMTECDASKLNASFISTASRSMAMATVTRSVIVNRIGSIMAASNCEILEIPAKMITRSGNLKQAISAMAKVKKYTQLSGRESKSPAHGSSTALFGGHFLQILAGSFELSYPRPCHLYMRIGRDKTKHWQPISQSTV